MKEVYWDDIAKAMDMLTMQELRDLPREWRDIGHVLHPPSTCGMCGNTYAVGLTNGWADHEDGTGSFHGYQVRCKCGLVSPICQHPAGAWAVWDRMRGQLWPLRGPIIPYGGY